MYPAPRTRSALRAFAAAGLVLLAGACGGGDAADGDVPTPDAVDEASPIEATEREVAAFSEPADSVLTPQQVDAYLRTTLLQFDLIREESKGFHERAQKIEERDKRGGVVAGLRNIADAGGLMADMGNVIGGSYVRAARTLGYNPAEMEWVRERMGEVSGYMAMRPMYEMAVEQAGTMRELAEQYRGQPGFTEEQIQEMLTNADETERQAREQMAAAGAVSRNLEVLHGARPNVTDHMWTAVGIVGGAGGLLAWSGLSNPQDTTSQRQLDEWRRVYTDALNDRVTPGMEAEVAPGDARPRLDDAPAEAAP